MAICTCIICDKERKHHALGMCRGCYVRYYREQAYETARQKREAAKAAEPPFGLCMCGQTAVTVVTLRYGKKGEKYNLCAACVELAKKQEGMKA